jgi:hypothetical protein
MDFITSTSTKSTLVTKSRLKNIGRINNLLNTKLSSSSTKPTPTPESHENNDIFNEISPSEKFAMLSPVKSLSRKK